MVVRDISDNQLAYDYDMVKIHRETNEYCNRLQKGGPQDA